MDAQNKYRRIVIKVGSNVLTRDDGRPDTTRISALVDQVARLHRAGTEVILVSSGAVASGRSILGQRAGKLDSVSARQLFSAVGQVKLLNRYYDLFNEYGIVCGQVLTTKESLSTRRQYLNQRNCMETMLANGVLPIVNENDTISVTELMFTDNDELSGLIASMMDAQALIILSNVDGIYNGSPADPESQVIREIEQGKDLSSYIQTSKSSFGRGGMLTKTNIARKVADEGITVIIANGKRDNILVKIMNNEELNYTRFIPSPEPVSSIKKWIAHSEGFAKGELHINHCATELLFSDNDELSGLVAAMMNAEALIILSNIDGIYDGSPADPASQVIRRVKPSEDLSQYIDPVRSSRGRGGMATKSHVSSRAAAEGIEVIIANGRRDGILTDLVLTGEEVPCTRFEPAPRAASGVKKWIASSEGFAKGVLRIDEGAAAAVRASKAASILAVGVTAVEGDFERDDLVRILSPDGAQLAVGRISCDSATARRNIGRKGLKPLVHCDYLYLE